MHFTWFYLLVPLFLLLLVLECELVPCNILRRKERRKREGRANAAISSPPRLFTSRNIWTYAVVPFRFHDNYNNQRHRRRILTTMGRLEEYTCVRFHPVESGYNGSHLLIESGRECASYVGRQEGEQLLSLPRWCLDKPGGVLHELLHSLGFGHEQTRIDRARFVSVEWDNIPQQFWPAFEEDVDAHVKLGYVVPYDYNSILHYGPFDYARRKTRPTITSTNPHFWVSPNKDISFLDLVKVNLLYKCRRHLHSLTDVCMNYLIGCKFVRPEDCRDSDYLSAVCKKSCGMCT